MSARRKTRSRPQRGVSLAWTVVLLSFVVVALTALTTLFADDMQRTRALTQGAQQRQFLLAAQQTIAAALAENRPVPATLSLPAELADARCTIQTQDQPDPNRRIFFVQAVLTQHRLTQSLQFERVGSSWLLRSAILQAPPRPANRPENP